MIKAVRYDEFGGIDVLRVAEVERPVPGDGQVLVRVKAAGINPSEAVIRAGAVAELFPSTFPSGQGSDLAGVVEEFTAILGLSKYAIYVQDYGAPVGYRLASRHPDRVTAIVVQNGNAYDEGLDNDFWKPLKTYWQEPTSLEKRNALRAFINVEATRWQYTHGVPHPEFVSPDGWTTDQYLLDRPGNDEIQLDLFLSYGSNPPLYPHWQEYFRKSQPPVLIVWGRKDQIFQADEF